MTIPPVSHTPPTEHAASLQGAVRKIIVMIVLVLGGASMARAYVPPEVYVHELVAAWNVQAAGDRDNTGFALSVSFINWPSIFLREMNSHPEVFRAWLPTLMRHTAKHTGEPGRGLWVIRQMERLAIRWDGRRYRDMTASIRSAAAACIANMQSPGK
jgi:hypothetical protein